MKTHPKAKSPRINAGEVAWLLPVAVLRPFGSSPALREWEIVRRLRLLAEIVGNGLMERSTQRDSAWA
jgi:hypothetical protein